MQIATYLPRRRLRQISVLEILLLTTACATLIVCCQSRVLPAIVYTLGFIGGLVGTCVALSQKNRNIWGLLLTGLLVGVAVGAVGIWVLDNYFPWDSRLAKVQEAGVRHEPSRYFQLAGMRGGGGGLLAVVLFTGLQTASKLARSQRRASTTSLVPW